MGEIKELFIEHKHAECWQCKAEDIPQDYVPGLSLRQDSTTSALLQIRTHAGIGAFGGGIKRHMLAHLSLDRDQLAQLRDAINEVLPRLTAWPHP